MLMRGTMAISNTLLTHHFWKKIIIYLLKKGYLGTPKRITVIKVSLMISLLSSVYMEHFTCFELNKISPIFSNTQNSFEENWTLGSCFREILSPSNWSINITFSHYKGSIFRGHSYLELHCECCYSLNLWGYYFYRIKHIS